ncbi:HAD family hydrolase [Enterococcus raffinosus]|uniref:HAD family hydrolase n=1 Tax=Enterococcus raffinosus TaxID=71452 RepID=UPI0028928787|nr:HAD family hydrolase [Enterococcus raffinosus]MDT2556634.1 HAD family hydrolase [Enterococcus raffinosus]
MYTTILFDIDGTLLDSNPMLISAFKKALESVGLKYSTEKLDYIIGLTENEAATLFTKHDEEKRLLISNWTRFVKHSRNDAKLFPGVIDVLSLLLLKNKNVGIVTSKRKKHMLVEFDRFNINHYFDTIVTSDDVKFPKPNPEPLELAMTRLNADKESTLYIGDTKSDWSCSKSAGVDFALASWGTTLPSSSFPNSHILSRIDDLKKYL